MNYMYILKCADDSFYTGSTKDLPRRLWQHENGMGANHTKKRLPVKLVYCEPYARIDEAYGREKQIQGWSRRKKQALIDGNQQDLIEFSKNYTEYGRPEDRPMLAEPVEGNTASSPSTSSPSTSSGGELVLTVAEPVEANTNTYASPSLSPETSTSPPEPVEGKNAELSQTLYGQMAESAKLDEVIRQNLEGLGYGE